MAETEKRTLRSRASTLLTVDETVERIDLVARDLAVQLERFSTTLDSFVGALDRFSDAVEKIDAVASRLEPVVEVAEMVTAPVHAAKGAARRVLRQ
jgi:hypothetical protein